MMRNLAIAGASALVGTVSFFAALVVHFPEEALIERLQYELQERGGGGWALQASGARPWLPLGITLTDVILLEVDKPRAKPKRRKRKDAEDEAAEEDSAAIKAVPFMRASAASIRLALLPNLLGKQQFDFSADVYGGELSGSYTVASERRQIEVDGEELDLSLVPIGGEDWTIDATGQMNIDMDVDLSDKKGRNADHSGTIKIGFDQLAFPRISASGMDLMPVSFSAAGLELELKGDKAEITKGRFEGDVMDATFSGNLTVSGQELSRWRMRVEIALELDEKLGQMANMLPTLRAAKDEQGVYHFLCTGSLGNPDCREDRSKARGGGAPSPSPIRRPGGGNIDDGPTFGKDGPPGFLGPEDGAPNMELDPDAEARRQARKDRIKERRERLRKQREQQGGDPDVREFDEGDGPVGPPNGPEPIEFDDGGPNGGEPEGPPEDEGQGDEEE